MPVKGFYDEPYRAKPEVGTPDDDRRSMDRTNRRIDILFNLINRFLDVDRVTGATTLTVDQYNVFANTDSAAVTVTLPAGEAKAGFRIVNTGSSANLLTITPNGTDELLGANSNWTLNDGEALEIHWDDDDGWY